ncbi:MAG: hypothetical protein WA715_29205 [Candidatus Acidiferrum sp.]
MLRTVTSRHVIPAILGALFGFLALAFAAESEPRLPVAVLSIISPGLEIAEMVTPAPSVRHEPLDSLGPTSGGFLRVAIAVNTLLYFVVFSLIGYPIERPRCMTRAVHQLHSRSIASHFRYLPYSVIHPRIRY